MFNFYLDDYNLIKTNICEELLDADLKVLCNEKDTPFELIKEEEYLLFCLNKDYEDGTVFSVLVNGNKHSVEPRFITYSKRFDDEFKVDLNCLGSFVYDDKTNFRLWSPLSNKAYLMIDGQEKEMNYLGKGLFEITIEGNKERSLYHYKTIREKVYEFSDPFSYSDLNGESFVVDNRKISKERITPKKIKNNTIYEINVRDFSSDNNLPFRYPKKLFALIEEGLLLNEKPIGIDYIEKLGVTHLQLMPIFSFDLDGKDYNWGYNPLTFNTVEDTYLVSDDPYERIDELKQVVNTAHKKGLRINLDVVYNHVYKDYKFNLTQMLPYYFLRYIGDEKADGSFCGNETRSESYFLKEYLKVLVNRFIDIYDIDGLRFDLMGLIDVDTILEIRDLALKSKSDFMIYGEGWNMGEVLPLDRKASMENAYKMEGVAFFNNHFRDILRGKDFQTEKAYLLGEISLKDEVKKLLSGSGEYGLNSKQSINYVECHDNFTLFDKVNNFFNNNLLTQKVVKLALAMTCLSKGIPFIHSGQEFLRTKNNIDNTYNLSDEINKLDWQRKNDHSIISEYLSDLLKLRNKYEEFYNDNVSISFDEYYEVLVYHLNNLTIFINPCVFDHIYSSADKYRVIFDDNGFNDYENKDIAIPSFSVVVAIKIDY